MPFETFIASGDLYSDSTMSTNSTREREAAEAARDTAERARIAAEELRAESERERLESEAGRQAAEDARQGSVDEVRATVRQLSTILDGMKEVEAMRRARRAVKDDPSAH